MLPLDGMLVHRRGEWLKVGPSCCWYPTSSGWREAIGVKQLARHRKQMCQWRKSNSWPLDYESKTLTTRPNHAHCAPPLGGPLCTNHTKLTKIKMAALHRVKFLNLLWQIIPITLSTSINNSLASSHPWEKVKKLWLTWNLLPGVKKLFEQKMLAHKLNLLASTSKVGTSQWGFPFDISVDSLHRWGRKLRRPTVPDGPMWPTLPYYSMMHFSQLSESLKVLSLTNSLRLLGLFDESIHLDI